MSQHASRRQGARASSPAALEAPTPEQALSKLLSHDQLSELAVFISSIADLMQTRITTAFDVDPFYLTIAPPRERLAKNARNPNVDPTQPPTYEESEAESRARKLQARRERDLDEPKLRQLKKDAVEFFQSWRDGIVSKAVDALNMKDPEEAAEIRGEMNPDAMPPPDYKLLGLHANIQHTDESLGELYPPVTTQLSTLPKTTRSELLSTMLLLVLSQGHYVAHSRIFLLYVASSLHLPLHVLHENEIKVAQGLLGVAKQMSADEETKKRSQENQAARRWKIGLAGVAGAAVVGLTGGLAAPLVAGALGAVLGGIGLGSTVVAGVLGTLASSGVIVGSLFGAYGYGMTSKMMDQYAKEVEDFAFLPRRFRRGANGAREIPAEDRRLRVTVGVSGWLVEKTDVVNPWKVLGQQSEVFALRWELDALMEMGRSLKVMVTSTVWTIAAREVISRTVFASLMFAMWPIALLKLSKVVDNPFNIAKSRADKAGLVLADAIINKAQGERPITLIGYSMGARLIYSCLMSLAERRAFGLVESVVLIGTPAPSDPSVWRAIRSVVAGRVVNVYSEKDYILAFLYRTSSIQFGVAGLEEIPDVKGVENIDATTTVSGHLRYPLLVGNILEHIGWEDINTQEVEREQNVIKMMDQEEERRMQAEGAETATPISNQSDNPPTMPPRRSTNQTQQQQPSRHPVQRNSKSGSLIDPLGALSVQDRDQKVVPNPYAKQPPRQPAKTKKVEDLISFDDPPPPPRPTRSSQATETTSTAKMPESLDSFLGRHLSDPDPDPHLPKPTVARQIGSSNIYNSQSPLTSTRPESAVKVKQPEPEGQSLSTRPNAFPTRPDTRPARPMAGPMSLPIAVPAPIPPHTPHRNIQTADQEVDIYDDSEEESGGITMVDNEITMLDPEPIPDDDDDGLGHFRSYTVRR